MLHEVRARGRRLDHSPIRSEIAVKNCDPRAGFEWSCEGVDYIGIPAGSLRDIFPNVFSIDGQRVTMEHSRFTELAKNTRDPSRIVEIFHQVFAGRLNVDETRQAGTDPVEIVESERHADPAGDRDQVNHRV